MRQLGGITVAWSDVLSMTERARQISFEDNEEIGKSGSTGDARWRQCQTFAASSVVPEKFSTSVRKICYIYITKYAQRDDDTSF